MASPYVDNLTYRPAVSSGGESKLKLKIQNEEDFRRMLAIERKRTERSNEPFLLVLIENVDWFEKRDEMAALHQAMHSLLTSLRETDVVGWYLGQSTLGIIFTGLPQNHDTLLVNAMVERVDRALREGLTAVQFHKIRLSCHLFPDVWKADEPGERSNRALYPDLCTPETEQKAQLKIKRVIDILGSAFLIAVLLPLFAAIAIAVKLSSRGPVFFRQTRVGQYGRPFTFLKFRSMHEGNDQRVHQKYVERLIAGRVQPISVSQGSEQVYKLAHDKRITRIGNLLRRTSLDELPQFLNVLKGDMSLVGPRPPIPYELAAYETWHRRRLLQVKPGITGLWQVTGRSRVTFDEMVRLDLQYATSWTPWLDIWILLRTPGAVIKGAY